MNNSVLELECLIKWTICLKIYFQGLKAVNKMKITKLTLNYKKQTNKAFKIWEIIINKGNKKVVS